MKCLVCARFCVGVMCKQCLGGIALNPQKRFVLGVPIYTFFRYEDIDFLISSKYHTIGSRVFYKLSHIASDYFFSTNHSVANNLKGIYGVGIDDYVRSFYSHTGIILKAFSKRGIRPIYGQLRARNAISYAGKSLAFREANKKNYVYNAGARDLIIVDDIITTGTSFSEAIEVCNNAGARVVFGIALCNAGRF